MTALIFVSSSEVDEVFSDVVNKYNPTSTNEDDIAITQFVDQLQNSESRVTCLQGQSYFQASIAVDGLARAISIIIQVLTEIVSTTGISIHG